MVRAAKGDEIGAVVRSAFGARVKVVEEDEGGVPAPGNATAVIVAAEDGTAQGRRDVLFRSPRGAHVGVLVGAARVGAWRRSAGVVRREHVDGADMLGVAGGHFDDLGGDVDGVRRRLPGAPRRTPRRR